MVGDRGAAAPWPPAVAGSGGPLASAGDAGRVARRFWFLAVGSVIWVAPVVAGLAGRVWNTEQGAQGPIVFVTGLWALWRGYQRHADLARPGSLAISVALLGAAALGYVASRLLGILPLACLAAYAGLVAVLYGHAGAALVGRLWFPLCYLLFVVPPPYFAVAAISQVLKLWVATRAVDLMSFAGAEVASSGTAIFIDGYELQVEAACAGMNSIVSLLGVGLFYVKLRHGDHWRYAALLALLIVPIAILANLGRVVILLMLVRAGGDAVLETGLHPAAGLLTFAVALGLLLLVDAALAPLRRAWRPRTA